MSSDEEDYHSRRGDKRRRGEAEEDSDDDTDKLQHRGRRRTNNDDAIYGVFAEAESDEEEDRRSGRPPPAVRLAQPMSFVSARSGGMRQAVPVRGAEDAGFAEEEDEEEDGDDEPDGTDTGRSKDRQAGDEAVLERLGLGRASGLGLGIDEQEDMGQGGECMGQYPSVSRSTAAPPPFLDENDIQLDADEDSPASGAQGAGMTNTMFRDLFLKSVAAELKPVVEPRADRSSVDLAETVGVPAEEEGTGGGLGMRNSIGTGAGVQPNRQIKPPPKADPLFARFEQHTKGFGAKYLSKFGFAGRLGKAEQGIAAPIDVKVRPSQLGLGFAGFKEATKLARNIEVQKDYSGAVEGGLAREDSDWSGEEGGRVTPRIGRPVGPVPPAPVRQPRPAKTVYKTAAELMRAQDGGGVAPLQQAGAGTGPIIDMTGRTARVVGTVADALTRPSADEEDLVSALTVGKEVVHNVGLLADAAEVDLTHTHRRLRAAEASVAALRREAVVLRAVSAASAARAAAIEGVRSTLSLWAGRLRAGVLELQAFGLQGQSKGGRGAGKDGVGPHPGPAMQSYLHSMYGESPAQAGGALPAPFRRLLHVLHEAAAAYALARDSAPTIFQDLHLLRAAPAMIEQSVSALCVAWEPVLNDPVHASPGGNNGPPALDFTLTDEGSVLFIEALRQWADLVSRDGEGEGWRAGVADYEDEDEGDGGVPLPPGARLRGMKCGLGAAVPPHAALAVSAFHKLVDTCVLGRLRALMRSKGWDVRRPRAMLALCHALSPGAPSLLSCSAFDGFLQTHILPVLCAGVEAWDPMRDTVPVQDWTVPWADPGLCGNDAMRARVWPTVRAHMQSALSHAWQPDDDSAVGMLRAWDGVWEPRDMESLCSASVIPKLVALLRELTGQGEGGMGRPVSARLVVPLAKGQPSQSQTHRHTQRDAFGWIVSGWCVDGHEGHAAVHEHEEEVEGSDSVGGGLLSSRHVSALLEGEFLGPWIRALATHLLGLSSLVQAMDRSRATGAGLRREEGSGADDGLDTGPSSTALLAQLQRDTSAVRWADVHAWYTGWRGAIPGPLMRLPVVRAGLSHALHLCSAVALIQSQVHDAVGTARAILQWYAQGDRSSYAAALARQARHGTGGTGGTRMGGTGPRSSAPSQPPPLSQPASMTFREYVEGTLTRAGLALLPNARRAAVDGCAVFKAGELNVYMQHGVVFAEASDGAPGHPGGGSRYEPIAVEELVARARQAAQRR